MKPPDKHEELMSRHRLATPGPGLRKRVLATAKNAWDDLPEDIPWQMPVLRLAACLVAAPLIIAAANETAPQSIAVRPPPPPQRPAEVLPELEDLYARLRSVEIANRDANPRFLEQQQRLRDLLNEGSVEKTH